MMLNLDFSKSYKILNLTEKSLDGNKYKHEFFLVKSLEGRDVYLLIDRVTNQSFKGLNYIMEDTLLRALYIVNFELRANIEKQISRFLVNESFLEAGDTEEFESDIKDVINIGNLAGRRSFYLNMRSNEIFESPYLKCCQFERFAIINDCESPTVIEDISMVSLSKLLDL